MGEYKKVNESYHIAVDGGGYDIRPQVVGVNMLFSNARRISMGGNDFHDPERGITFERYINAGWDHEDYHFKLISEEGEQRIRPLVSVHIAQSETGQSSVSHFPEAYGEPEQVFFTFYLPEHLFEWLWAEIGAMPGAPVGVRIHFMPWLASIESGMWSEVSFNPIRLEAKSTIPIMDARFHVGEVGPVKAPQADEPATTSEKIEAVLESTDPVVWAKRIFWALVVIATILAYKR
jgi:hypothetical protein